MAYWILLVLYLILVLLYAYHYQHPTIQAWPLLSRDADVPNKPAACRDTAECPPYHVCLNQTCVPQFLRGGECDTETGDWTLFSHRGRQFTTCVCKNPKIVTQKHWGGNCDQEVACRPYGHYDRKKKECVCPEGFRATSFLNCVKLLAKERMLLEPCESDEVHYRNMSGGHGLAFSYINRNSDKPCFKRPCTFDAWSGKYLKRARYEQGMGCICDPSLGQFGVRLEGLDSYTRDEGYNACVSVFETPLEKPIFVQVFAYFYLMQRPPVVFIQYHGLNPSDVIEPLRSLMKNDALQIGQEFPYDYLQAHLRKREPFLTRSRNLKYGKSFHNPSYQRMKLQPNAVEWCRFMSRRLNMKDSPYELSFNLLNQFPMCYIGKDDEEAPEQYRGRYVLNPFHLTFQDPQLERTNSVELMFLYGKWILSLSKDYDVETYQIAAVNPNFLPDLRDDPVASLLEEKGQLIRDPFDEMNRRYYDSDDARKAQNEPVFS
ncbi:hypothetical protein AVEN_261801-1 [Araneus ventricosus]|uniref:EGF-like domain-containing protein n=1 Tax=Araneus ventricosus TaxID=182803 RepID=A0A4Y2LZG0_ARAVE|nr:hypothetical protein AVEN_261801-1 [Araneus ventricosus]